MSRSTAGPGAVASPQAVGAPSLLWTAAGRLAAAAAASSGWSPLDGPATGTPLGSPSWGSRGSGHAGVASRDPLEWLEGSSLLEVLLACWPSEDEESLKMLGARQFLYQLLETLPSYSST